jgi:hypothetical protein
LTSTFSEFGFYTAWRSNANPTGAKINVVP